MKQSQHTQGPWMVNKRKNNGGNYEITKCGQPIACVYTEEWGYDARDGQANANLLAAAPELLEALEGLHSLQTCFPQRNTIVAKALEKASAALNKAQGGL